VRHVPRRANPGRPRARFGQRRHTFTAEENKHDVHRRLAALDPDEQRKKHGKKLMVVPLPDAGGPIPLIKQNRQGLSATSQFEVIRQQLLTIDDLALVVFDPLQAFAAADINADPAAGQFFCSLMGTLAAETGATMLTTHHMRKPDRSQSAITTPMQAREAIRGTTALVDGMRCVFALWAAPQKHAGDVSRKLGIKSAQNRIVCGAVVKANGPADLAVRTFIRDPSGVLIDRTDDLRQAMPGREDQLVDLRKAIADAAERGYPLTKTGLNGVHNRRSDLPKPLQNIGRDKLVGMVQQLLDDGELLLCSAKGSKAVQWLDVPDGPFARGVGEFAPGASHPSLQRNVTASEVPDQE